MAELAAPLLRRQSPSRPTEQQAPPQHHSHAGRIAAAIVIIVLLIIAAIGGFYGYRFWRARRLGLPPPSLNPFTSQSAVSTRNYPARGGAVGWFQSKFRQMRNKRTAGGAYEAGRGSGARGFGPVDQDEGAWDPRMHDHEEEGYGGGRGYYEEQELGLTRPHARGDSDASYVSSGYGQIDTGYHAPRGLESDVPSTTAATGHSRMRSEYDVGNHGASNNPFADSAERSDMGVRPTVDTEMQGGKSGPHAKKGSKGDSPTSERRSIFHEEM